MLFQGKLALMRIVRVKKIVEDKEIWLPEFIEKKTYFKTYPMNESIGLPDDEKVPFALAQITISNFKAECDSVPEAFILDWPHATNVYDSILQKRYVVTVDFGDEPKRLAPPEVKENVTTPTPAPAAPESAK